MTQTIRCICKTCGIGFPAPLSALMRGPVDYCSRPCEGEKIKLACKLCGKSFFVTPSMLKVSACDYCSPRCEKKAVGEVRDPRFKDGNDRPDAYKKVGRDAAYQHRVVAESILGEKLGKRAIHHMDLDKHNNAPENLMVFESKGAHRKYHNGTGPEGVMLLAYIPVQMPGL